MMRCGVWFQQKCQFNVLIVTRRGYLPSEGSTIRSGELGIFYDVQAAISHLVKSRGVSMELIWIYGYSLGGMYSAIGGAYFPKIRGIIIDRGFPDYLSSATRVQYVT